MARMEAEGRLAVSDKERQLMAETKARRLAESKAKMIAAQLPGNRPKTEPYDAGSDVLGSMKGKKIADVFHRIINRQVAIGFLALFEHDGPSEYVPAAFHEALQGAKARGARGRAAKTQAAMQYQNDMVEQVARLEREVAERGRDLIDCEKQLLDREREVGYLRQELESVRGKLALALRGDTEAVLMQLSPRLAGEVASPASRSEVPRSPASGSGKHVHFPEDDGDWSGVNSTLARLSRARQVIRGHLPEDSNPEADEGSPGSRGKKGTLLQQAQLERQLLELQEYLNKVKIDLPKP